MCSPSEKLKRLRRFQTPAALLGPAEVIPESPVVVTPPLTTMPPGPPPLTNESEGAKDASSEESRLNPARENPARKVFSTCGEIMCVSSTLPTCMRSVLYEANRGSAKGTRLLPSSTVYEAESVSRWPRM